jgi:nitrite reductase/ring-hydroxylating ferredoxin subunit
MAEGIVKEGIKPGAVQAEQTLDPKHCNKLEGRMTDRDYVKVTEAADMPPGTMKAVEVGREQILLVNVNGSLYACDNMCPHAGGALSEGKLEDDEVRCRWHGSVFNVTSGQAVKPPAMENLRTFDVRVVGLNVLVKPTEDTL